MIEEQVYVADTLKGRYPKLHSELRLRLELFGIRLTEIVGTRDVWCRDYMPVQVGATQFVQFRYSPDYLVGARSLITSPTVARSLTPACRRSRLVMDGGNVVRRGRVAIVTDKIYAENSSMSRQTVMRRLRFDLDVDRVAVIPTEPGDVIGHADGVVHLLDERTALMNDYARVDAQYGHAVTRALGANGIEAIPVPYDPDLSEPCDIPVATGNYVNLLETPRAVFVPTYGQISDSRALAEIGKVMRHHSIVPIDCRMLAEDGGSLHCVTWAICMMDKHAVTHRGAHQWRPQ